MCIMPKDREEDIDTRHDGRAVPWEKKSSRVVHACEFKDMMWVQVLEYLKGILVWKARRQETSELLPFRPCRGFPSRRQSQLQAPHG